MENDHHKSYCRGTDAGLPLEEVLNLAGRLSCGLCLEITHAQGHTVPVLMVGVNLKVEDDQAPAQDNPNSPPYAGDWVSDARGNTAWPYTYKSQVN